MTSPATVECAAEDGDRPPARPGEALDEAARDVQVPVHEVEEWRRVFLEGGQQGLKRRGLDPEERELRRLQAKIGDMTMRLELAETLVEKRRVARGCAEAAEMSWRCSPIVGVSVYCCGGVRRLRVPRRRSHPAGRLPAAGGRTKARPKTAGAT